MIRTCMLKNLWRLNKKTLEHSELDFNEWKCVFQTGEYFCNSIGWRKQEREAYLRNVRLGKIFCTIYYISLQKGGYVERKSSRRCRKRLTDDWIYRTTARDVVGSAKSTQKAALKFGRAIWRRNKYFFSKRTRTLRTNLSRKLCSNEETFPTGI